MDTGDHTNCCHTIDTLPPPCLTRCAHCNKRERQLPAGAKLKRCKGCTGAMYCSRACQRAAWPRHRNSCGSVVSCYQDKGCAGYATSSALAEAIHDWVDDIHRQALETLANATILANGGIAANLGFPRVLRLALAPGDKSDDGADPAKAFSIVKVSVENRDDVPAVISSWDHIEADCQKYTRSFRKDSPDATVIGCIPAVCVVAGAYTATFHYFPVYGLQSGHLTVMPDYIRPVCEDVAAMCVETVNRGLVLRPSSCARCEHCKRGPFRGTLVRLLKKKKTWTWQPVDGGNWVPADDFESRSGLHPVETWAVYNAL
ncbi:hypothetical protein VTO73DRAFT_14313 [Trametes versicolor]